jgi:hypothetical protein
MSSQGSLLEYERELRDRGMDVALEHVEDWTERAWRIIDMLASTRQVFTSDDLVRRCGVPSSANAVGAIFKQARKRGLIEPVGLGQSTRPGRHAGSIRRWVGT